MKPAQAWPDNSGRLHRDEQTALRSNLSSIQLEIENVAKRAAPNMTGLDFTTALRAIGIERLRRLVAATDAVEAHKRRGGT